MKRCPNCNGSIIRMGHKEKPFFCNSCNKWFSNEEVIPKQTNADRIRMMTDEELADMLRSAQKNQHKDMPWLDWLKQEAEE